jgi:hypothetical protein
MSHPRFYRYSNPQDWRDQNGDFDEEPRYPDRGPYRRAPYRGDNYIRGVHEESDFSFGSDYIQDERAFRPSRMSQQSGSRSWINVGNSANSSDAGGRVYTSGEYNENPAYYEGDSGRGEGIPNNISPFSRREEPPFGMTSYPRYFKKSFAGRGPKDYQRSDERITEDINERLTQDHHVDATEITVETRSGEVTLRGTVSDRESKRRAEEIAESCSGVKDVQNQLRIQSIERAIS